MTVIGNVTLYVVGKVSISGQASLKILPGGSLTLYCGGDVSVTGGGIVNATGLPSNLSIIGLPTCLDIKMSGNGDFFGTINAPQASVTLGGGINVYGAVIANTFTAGGNGSLHYDNALAKKGDLMVLSWVEL